MTQAVSAIPAPIAGCAARFARLAADGTTPAGATNGYITRFVKVTPKREVEAGVDLKIKDACGDYGILYRERDVPIRWGLTLELLAPDPELEEMLTSATLLTQTLTTTRTFADGATTSGSTSLTSPALGLFIQGDVGSVVSGTGIPVGTKIAGVTGSGTATMSAPATATASALSVTITAAAISVGVEGPVLGSRPTDFGVSMEVFVKNVRGGILDPLFPYSKVAFPASFWTLGDPAAIENAHQGALYEGYATANPNWGNGPFNDWKVVKAGDTAVPLVSGLPMSRHYTSILPPVGIGYASTPVQV